MRPLAVPRCTCSRKESRNKVWVGACVRSCVLLRRIARPCVYIKLSPQIATDRSRRLLSSGVVSRSGAQSLKINEASCCTPGERSGGDDFWPSPIWEGYADDEVEAHGAAAHPCSLAANDGEQQQWGEWMGWMGMEVVVAPADPQHGNRTVGGQKGPYPVVTRRGKCPDRAGGAG